MFAPLSLQNLHVDIFLIALCDGDDTFGVDEMLASMATTTTWDRERRTFPWGSPMGFNFMPISHWSKTRFRKKRYYNPLSILLPAGLIRVGQRYGLTLWKTFSERPGFGHVRK